jgi:hypothetical protein
MHLRRRGKGMKSWVLFGILLALVAFARAFAWGEELQLSFTLEECAGLRTDAILAGPSPSLALYLPVFPKTSFRESSLTLRYAATPACGEDSTLMVYGEDVFLAAFRIFPGEHELRIPLSSLADASFGDTVKLEIRATLRKSDNLCEDLLAEDLFLHIRKDSTLNLSLSKATWTVRDFLRLPARHFHLVLPEAPWSQPLCGAYLKLYAFLRRNFRGLPVTIHTDPPGALRRSEEATPKERWIVLREQALRDVELSGNTLYLTPRGVDGLIAESPLFVGQSFRVRSVLFARESRRTFRDFGFRNTTLRGIGDLRERLYFTLADLGGVPRSLWLTLFWASTPLPETPRGEAFLKVFLNGSLVFVRKIPSGARQAVRKERIFLPARLLGRENALELVFSYFPEVGNCRRGTMPFEATIFEDSYFSGMLAKGEAPLTFADAPTLFSGKAYVVLPENPSLEELEVAGRIYGALREIDATPLALEVLFPKDLKAFRRGQPTSFPNPAVIAKWLKTGNFRLLFSPPPVLPEYFLIIGHPEGLLPEAPAALAGDTLTLSHLSGLETFALSPDDPWSALTVGEFSRKPALYLFTSGRKDLALAAFLRHFKGAETLRTLQGNVALFTLRGFGETQATSPSSPSGFLELLWRFRLFILAGACGVLGVWCAVLYRKLVRLRPL